MSGEIAKESALPVLCPVVGSPAPASFSGNRGLRPAASEGGTGPTAAKLESVSADEVCLPVTQAPLHPGATSSFARIPQDTR